MVIFGIDPGLNKTGVGVLEVTGKNIAYLSHAIIKTDAKSSLPDRLGFICSELINLINIYKPHVAGVEDIFYSVNIKSAILLGETRGAIMATLLNNNVKISEFTALQIKKAVVGYGKADKEQVKKMVEILLKIDLKKSLLDVSDALACGICLGFTLTGYQIG
ncbi:MAG: crossover junction endodeoxyribonuclease RuvC [Deferribacterales bacterium]